MPIIKIFNLTTKDIALKSFNGININKNSKYEKVHTQNEINLAITELERFKKLNLLSYSWQNEDLDVTGTVTMTTEERILKGGLGARIVYDKDLNTLYYWKTDIAAWVTVGSSSSGVFVQDEGVTQIQTDTLNFIGSDVLARDGTTRADIYIPPPSFASHFNTTDGTTTPIISNTSTSTRHVPSPTSEGNPFNVNGWTAGSNHACTRTTILSFTTPQNFRVTNNTTCTLTINVYDADGVTLLASHPITLTGNYFSTIDNITAQISNFIAANGEYEARLSQCDIALSTLLPNGGRFSIELINDNNGSFYTFTQNNLFYDPDDTAASLATVTIGETSGSVETRQISGIYYYNMGSDFTINITDIDNINDSSYPTNQITCDGSEYGLPQLQLQGSDLTDWVSVWNDIDDSYQRTDWEITSTNMCYVGAAQIHSRTEDWSSGSWVDSTNDDICINTYTDNSTRVYTDFRLETNRLENNFSTVWDNTQDITTYDSGNGLQCQCSRIVYPTFNFTAFEPNSGSQFDYSGESGDKTWNMRMWHPNISHSNGNFQFGDYNITETDITNNDFKLEISLDGVSWFNCNQSYLGGTLSDGDGCRINPGVNALNINNRLEFTLGNNAFTTVSSGGGWGIFIRLTFTDSDTTNFIGSFEIMNWV